MTDGQDPSDDYRSWTRLFERGAAYAVTLADVDAALATRRDHDQEEP